MPQYVDRTAIKTARRVCLYDFLLSRHQEETELEGSSLRLRCNHSVSVKNGYAGFTDFADDSTGNSVECLVNYLGYSFHDAVAALCEYDSMTPDKVSHPRYISGTAGGIGIVPKGSCLEPAHTTQRTFVPPKPLRAQCRQMFAYLTKQRSLPPAVVQQLIDWDLLYQAADHGNAVFIDPARTFAEIRGVNSKKPFHQIMFSDPAAFWWFKQNGPDSTATVAFICEGAIDAISLCILRQDPPVGSGLAPIPPGENALYCGIGGVANQQRIDRIKAGMSAAGCQAVIAVDNDQAGESCRRRNQDCQHIIPRGKDWNEDLIFAKTHRQMFAP